MSQDNGDKIFTITHSSTGEKREVTYKQWEEEKLGQQGWHRSADMWESQATERTWAEEINSVK